MADERVPPLNRFWYRFARGLVRRVVLPLLGGLRVVGSERVPMSGPLLVAPIHLSHIDPPLVACASPRIVRFMAKEELFRPVLLGPLIGSLGAFPVRRGEGDTGAIRTAVEVLRSGEALLVFPEGTRGDGRTLGEVQPGIAMLAKRSGATVLPVGLCGTERVLPRGASRPRRARMTVVFGEPFRLEDLADDEREARRLFAEEIARRVVAASREAGLDVRTVGSD